MPRAGNPNETSPSVKSKPEVKHAAPKHATATVAPAPVEEKKPAAPPEKKAKPVVSAKSAVKLPAKPASPKEVTQVEKALPVVGDAQKAMKDEFDKAVQNADSTVYNDMAHIDTLKTDADSIVGSVKKQS